MSVRRPVHSLLLCCTLVAPGGAPSAAAQEVPSARPSDASAPHLVCVDRAHGNMHTAGGTYARFADLLREAGFAVEDTDVPFDGEALTRCRVLLVSNALHPRNAPVGDSVDWSLPNPSAFTVEEAVAVRAWVDAGGGLLLIADHMPMPGSARTLAEAFGLHFANGFAVDTAAGEGDYGEYVGTSTLTFRSGADRHPEPRGGVLAAHPITAGVDSVRTYTGQGFLAGAEFRPLLVLPRTTIVLLPAVAWEFPPGTPVVDAGGWLQGAAGEFGSGRVVVLGEAAMLRPSADGHLPGQNGRFGVRAVRWLTRVSAPR